MSKRHKPSTSGPSVRDLHTRGIQITKLTTDLAFFTERAVLLTSKLKAAKDEKEVLTATNTFYAEEMRRKDAEIAILKKDAEEMFYMDPGHRRSMPAIPASSTRPKITNLNSKLWASDLRVMLQSKFPGKEAVQSCALKTLASADLSSAQICAILEERKNELGESTFLQTAVREGQLLYRDFLQDHLTPALGENMIKTLMLSRVKYNRLNQKLFYTFENDEDGKRVATLMQFNNVPAPQLPGRWKIESYRRKILEVFDLKVENGGLSTSLNLRAVLKADVLASIRQGFFVIIDGEVKQVDGQNVQAMNYTDTANHFKGMKVTASAVQLPDGSATPNSPFHTSEYALFEGSDGYEDILLRGHDEIVQANDLLDNPMLDLGPILVPAFGSLTEHDSDPPQAEVTVTCRIDFNFGGDQAHSGAMNCIARCNCACPCPFCEVSKHDMCSLKWETRETTRTRERIMLLAHSKLGPCPGCLRMIVPKGRVVDSMKQVELAADGDDDTDVPPQMKALATKTRPVTHETVHFGVVLGRIPPYHMDPDRWIVCLLHLNLCIVRGLFSRTIIAEYGKLPTSESLAAKIDRMAELLNTAGLRMKKNKLKKNAGKEVSNYDERLKNSGLGGKDAEFMMNARTPILQLMFPEDVCGHWIPDNVLFQSPEAFDVFYDAAERQDVFSCVAMQKSYNVRRAWFDWDCTWKLLTSKMPYPGEVSAMTDAHMRQVWATRADAVYVLAKRFISSWVEGVGNTQGLYLHIVVRHLPDQIRKFGDLRTRQTQGLEHCHYQRKVVGLHATNRKPGQRLATMMVYSALKRAAMQDDEVQVASCKAEIERLNKEVRAKKFLAKALRLGTIGQKLEVNAGLLVNSASPFEVGVSAMPA
jgi:hypothetical protein